MRILFHGDIKFPHRLPILPETHEIKVYDVKRCMGKFTELDLAYQVQAGQAVTAGYFGGYAAKMQLIGKKELQRLQQGIERKIEVDPQSRTTEAFKAYGRRLVKDLEGKGILRTAVEATSLALFASHPDQLMAECIRTFPSITFPATLLLRREEIENGSATGRSIIAAIRHGSNFGRIAHVEAPFDLMYGFRGTEENVDLLSAFEMLMHWTCEEVKPPGSTDKSTGAQLHHSELTPEGVKFRDLERNAKRSPQYIPGEHYIALPGSDRILLPVLPCLKNLRHMWMWQKRPRPCVPVWNYSKIPKSTLSPNENARLLNVYMRPWTLDPATSSVDNVLLSELSTVSRTAQEQDKAALTDHSGLAQDLKTSTPSAQAAPVPLLPKSSHAESWQRYIKGNVISRTSQRYISNLLAATAARVVEKADSSADEDNEDEALHFNAKVGDMALIADTLKGIAAQDEDEGARGVGKHGACIRIGIHFWETSPLSATEEQQAVEPLFDDGQFPPLREALDAAKDITRMSEERLEPFTGRTEPYAHLSMNDYGARMDTWFTEIQSEQNASTQQPEPPTHEQMHVLHVVRDRVLCEFALKKEGAEVPLHLEQLVHGADAREPLRGLIHGLPGTGKSKVIMWIRRMFEEALGWQHDVEFICVAFQNRMAAAMGGNTLHNASNLRPGEKPENKLSHSDLDNLYTKNQHLRWIIIDEISMVADDLLGHFENELTNAAVVSQFSKRADRSIVIMGGYNLLMFGDWWQLPPIPDTNALFIPPTKKKSEIQRCVLDMFWGNSPNALNFFKELTIEKRVENSWYASFLTECRNGHLSSELRHFLFGYPTQHAGSWYCTSNGEERLGCNSEYCRNLPTKWRELARAGKRWHELQDMECAICKDTRASRNRLVDGSEEELHKPPFCNAPFVHKNNEPKYHALLLRAVETAKRHKDGPKQIL